MKVVILAGGFGTRLAEETDLYPKPMVRIGGRPILWHIMKIFAHHGYHDFVVCLGYRGYMIKDYFANYLLHESDVTIDLAAERVEVHRAEAEPWRITLADTGERTMTAGRIRRVARHFSDERFLLTYGDGLADIDLPGLIETHDRHRPIVTVTAVRPPPRFGSLQLDDGGAVKRFSEKPAASFGWINGGFFVVEPEVLDYLGDDDTMFEREPLERLASEGRLAAYRHEGFWLGMDTLRDKRLLESLWEGGSAPWKTWTD